MTAGEGRSTDWPAVLVAVACGIAVAFNIGKVPIALAQLRAEFGLSLVGAGWVASTFNTLAVFTAILFGMACDRVGQLRMASFGIVLSIAAGIAALFVQGNAGLLASRVVEGVGFLSIAVSAPGLISTVARAEDRRFALGLWATFMPVGVGLAMVLGPLVMPLGGWRALWLASIAVFVLAGLALFQRRAAYGHAHASIAGDSLAVAREAVSQPAPWLFGFSLCSWAVQYFALVVWLPTFLREQRGLEPTTVGLLTALVVLINAPGTVLGGALIQRHIPRGKLIVGASAATAALSFGIYLDWLPDLARYLLCLVLSFIGGLIPTAVLSSSLVLARSPRQIGTLQGLFMQCANLAQFVGPPAIAALVASSGRWSDALYVTGSAAVTGILLGLAIQRIERSGAQSA
ncbi:MAG: MFS transporter [Rhodocyclales bacterium]|nr:MFS transporter [Rhodocyclales bacterium]